MARRVKLYRLPLGRTALQLKEPAEWEGSLVDAGGGVAGICVLEDSEGAAVAEAFHVVADPATIPQSAIYHGSVSVAGAGVLHVFRGRG